MSNEQHKNSSDLTTRKHQKRIKGSYIWAVIFTVAIAGWFLSGALKADQGQDVKPNSDKQAASPAKSAKVEKTKQDGLFRVRVKTIHASKRKGQLVIRGRTEARARVQIKAETAAIVKELPVLKGAFVEKGTVLCKLNTGARQASLLEARAALAKAEADFEATKRLVRKGHSAKLKSVEFLAKVDSAKAALKRAELDLAYTNIKAPFSGIIEAQEAKAGDFLSVGATCATLVSVNPLLAVGAVSERDIKHIKNGMPSRVDLVTGDKREGKITFVSPSSEIETRTFRIEIEIPNSDYKLRDGVTADIRIPLQSTKAHHISPAILALDDDGQIGIRIIDAAGLVKFTPVKIISDSANGIWITGLPDPAMVITVGQEYVTNGQKVDFVEDKSPKLGAQLLEKQVTSQ